MNDRQDALEDGAFLALLVRHLKMLGSPESLSMDSNLFELGLDSTAALDLLFELEECFSVVFPESLLTDATFETPAALHAALKSLMRHPAPL